MIKLLALGLMLCSGAVMAKNPVALMETSMGKVTIELYKDKAPISVKNFIRYAKEGKYNGTVFHRVINNFMIQGGGFLPGMKKVKTHEPIKNEAKNGVANEVGTIAMARTGAIDSATNQFFINVNNNSFLNHRGPGRAYGYAVFGRVTKGMSVVNKIKMVKTGKKQGYGDVPVSDIVIKKVTIQGAK